MRYFVKCSPLEFFFLSWLDWGLGFGVGRSQRYIKDSAELVRAELLDVRVANYNTSQNESNSQAFNKQGANSGKVPTAPAPYSPRDGVRRRVRWVSADEGVSLLREPRQMASVVLWI